MKRNPSITLKLAEARCPTRVTVVDGVEEASRVVSRPLQPPDPEVDPLEALYMLYRGYAVMCSDDKSVISFEEYMKLLASCDDHVWIEFEVYLDLRKRGRLPVRGPRPHTFLIKRRKGDDKYVTYILVLEENRRIPFILLKSFIEEACKNGWEPMIAIVDRYGDVTYYKPHVISFAKD